MGNGKIYKHVIDRISIETMIKNKKKTDVHLKIRDEWEKKNNSIVCNYLENLKSLEVQKILNCCCLQPEENSTQ